MSEQVIENFKIVGVDCADCAKAIEHDISEFAGVKRATFNFFASNLEIETIQNQQWEHRISEVLQRHGGTLIHNSKATSTKQNDETAPLKSKRKVILASGIFLLFGFAISLAQFNAWYSITCYLLTVLISGRTILTQAFHSLKARKLTMNVLMALAVVGAIGIGEWAEAAMVIFLFAIANYLEVSSMFRARNAVNSLIVQVPKSAKVMRDGAPVQVQLSEIAVNDILLVHPGEQVAVDGQIISGETEMNEAAVTGESMPVAKNVGDNVVGGAINRVGVVQVRVSKTAEYSTLAQLKKLVEQAANQRAEVERFIDRFAQIYTPVVVALAVGVAILPPIFLGNFQEWFYRGLVLLIISCPCALVISTPVSVVSGLANAAHHGVLIKGGAFLEMMSKVKILAFDKTGTLTLGKPHVASVEALSSISKQKLIQIAAALEQHSEHLIAKAIVDYAEEQNLPPLNATEIKITPGLGVSGLVEGATFYIGNKVYLEKTIGMDSRKAEDDFKGIFLWNEREILGQIIVQDELRRDARRVVDWLQERRITTTMLTGDNQKTAEQIAREANINNIHAELLPADKLKMVQTLNQRGDFAMVGDGLNDAPALSQSAIGIAMGRNGIDLTLEAADIVLMKDDLKRIPFLIELSKKVQRIIQQNIVFAIGIKVLFTILVIPGFTTLWMAVGADVGASVLVVFNGLRALKTKMPVL